ncbi:diguanylate cyclase domain-containing protein [Granulosicoccus sp. 3-233]|uniref:diguanylate cyclase domain-containing protein n=1 Tax=Granulosicoccus sp. 3-233 TaxID=3417969 RepID=UPI003D3259F2
MNLRRNQTGGTIVVLTDEYVDYRKDLVDTISGIVSQSGYGTLCIAGQQMGNSSVCNSIYCLATEIDVVGIICLTGTLGQKLSNDELATFINRFKVPVLSLGLPIEGVDSVFVNDCDGMIGLMQHLLKNRDCSRLAFIRGFPGDPYSLRRESIFRRVLEENGHRVDEDLFVEGNYDAFRTYGAVTSLLKRRQDVDTFVAANDIMALSAARAVKVAGYSIPDDIAITGFDDTSEATRNSPPISTVRQPFDSMASLSVNRLLQRIAGECGSEAPDDAGKSDCYQVCVDCEFIPRASTHSRPGHDETLSIGDTASISRWLHAAMSGLSTPDTLDLEVLSSALWQSMTTDCSAAAECMQDMLDRSASFKNIHWWVNLCDRIESLTVAMLGQGFTPEASVRILLALSRIRERMWAFNVEHDYHMRRHQGLRAAMQLRMSSCSDQDGLLQTMTWWLQAMEPRRSYLVKYDKAGERPDENASLLHQYQDGQVFQPEEKSFPTRQLLPDHLLDELRTGELVLNPIHAGGLQFGYLLMDPVGFEQLDLHSAAHSIGNAMRTHFHIGKLEYQADSLQAANQRLLKLAHYDTLTDLPNRSSFQEALGRRCQNGESLILMYMDLDGFKAVNDSAGHDAGDQLLRQVADRLRECVSELLDERACLARLGGDEFTLIASGHFTLSGISAIANRLRQSLSMPYLIDDLTHCISVSIGCARFPEDADSSTLLIKNADAAMYDAKLQGKNAFSVFPLSESASLPRVRQA